MDLNLNKGKKERKKSPIDWVSMQYGKIPPQDKAAEEAVLGTLTLDPKAMSIVYPILQEDSFYVEQHQIIYNACVSLFIKSQPVDIVTVCAELNKMGKLEMAGGPFYVTQLQNKIVRGENVKAHSLIIEEKAIARRIISVSGEVMNDLFTGEIDVFELIDKLQEGVFAATSKIQQAKKITLDHIAVDFLKQIERGMQASGMTGMPTGIQDLDDILGGLQKQNVILIAARPRHGKSAVATAMMAASTKIRRPDYDPKIHKSISLYPVGYLSMEMRNTEVFARLVSNELNEMNYQIPYSRIQRGLITEDELKLVNQAIERLIKKGIYIDDTPALTPQIIKAKIIRMIEEFDIKAVYIDYLQLTQVGKQLYTNGAENISQNMSEFKNMAKEFDIPVILLSQVDRSIEKQTPRKAVLSDMKGSGGIEEKSDVVLILFNPSVLEDNPTDENGQSLKGIILVDIAKNKMGETKEIKVPFDVKTNSIGTMDGVVSQKIDQFLNHPLF